MPMRLDLAPERAGRLASAGPHKTAVRPAALAPALFVVPFLLVYLVLLVYPLGLGFWMALHDVDLLAGDAIWIGLDNYARLFADPIFLRTVLNTLLFVALTMPAFVVLGLALALALDGSSRTNAVLRGVFFSSSVLSVTVGPLVWRMVYEPHGGLVANGFSALGWPAVAFLSDTRFALPAVALTTVWWIVGLPMVLFLSALQQIPREVYEAAALDNAGRWTTLTRITLPSIRRTILLVAIIEVVLQFQVFGQTFRITPG